MLFSPVAAHVTDSSERTPVKTTQTSLGVLAAIRGEDGARVNEIAEAVGKSTSTVHRHLVTLEDAGFVQRYGGEFHLGLKFLDYGEYVRSQWPLQAIDDVVLWLNEETGEEVDFLTEDRGRVITIGKSYRKYHRLVKYAEDTDLGDVEKHRAQVGNYYHMHVTGAGKAILAEYPDSRVTRIVDRWGLPEKTGNSITDRERLFEELDRTRKRGYAISDGEYTTGLTSLAKVVPNPNGGVLGALNVAGPTYRMSGVVVEREIPEALEAASDSLEAEVAERGGLVRDQSLNSV